MGQKKPLARIFSFSLASLMFITSLGIAIDMHFCQGHLKRINLFGKAKTCQEVSTTTHCKHHARTNQAVCDSGDGNHSGCCSNEMVKILLDEDLVDIVPAFFKSVDFDQMPLVFFDHPTEHDQLITSHIEYLLFRPPIPKVKRSILYCTFLC